MTRKSKILTSTAVFLTLLACALLYLAWPLRTIQQLRARLETVQRGMSFEEVLLIIAHTPVPVSERWYPAWDDERLPPTEADQIVSAVRYSVKTFYMPVMFEFTFDSDRRLIGRHIYD